MFVCYITNMASNNNYLTISQLHDNNTPWDTLSITQKQYARNQGWNKSKWTRTLETHNNNSTEPNIVFLDIDGVVGIKTLLALNDRLGLGLDSKQAILKARQMEGDKSCL